MSPGAGLPHPRRSNAALPVKSGVANQGLGFAAADALALFSPFCRLAGAQGLPGLGTAAVA